MRWVLVVVAALGRGGSQRLKAGALLVAVFALGCGRFGFEAGQSDAASDAIVDGNGDAPPVEASLLLWLPFDGSMDNRGSLQAEASCDPSCPSTVAGMRGAAGGFDGSTTGVRIADKPELHVTAGTIAMWMRPLEFPLTTEARSLAGAAYGTESLNSWEVYFSGDLAGTTLISGGDVGSPQIKMPWDRGAGDWFHVASTWNGTTRHALYLDGVEVANGPQFVIAYDNHDVMIGVDETGVGLMHRFHGDIDDVRFYGRALSQDEIAQLATP